ncbi:MAG: chromosome partitioning protein [Blastopirellula sp.]|nr:chromosome partitioning protein [Blastopirellula sp.]
MSVLIVTTNTQLQDELEAALAALGEAAPLHQVTDSRTRAVQLMRNRSPDLLLVEMSQDVDDLRTFIQEMSVVSPQTTVAAIFMREAFEEDISESDLIIQAMRAGVKDFLRRPVSTTDLARLLEQAESSHAAGAADNCRVVTFVSNKGGVGKSTLSVNTAVGLARRYPDRVLLIDGSLQMGVVAPMLDLVDAPTLTDASRERDRLDTTMLRQLATRHESGLHVLPAPNDAIDAAEVDDELMTRIITLARPSFDYVVVDTFPLFDRVIVAILDMSDRVFVVTENVVPTLLGAVRMVDVLDRIGVPEEKQSIVLNRFTSIAGSLSAEDVANRLQRPIDHVVPFEKRIITSANTGDPFVMQNLRFNKARRAIDELVGRVIATDATDAEFLGQQETLPVPAGANGTPLT